VSDGFGLLAIAPR